MRTATRIVALAGVLLAPAIAAEEVKFGSPGFAATSMDGGGRLIEDWGTIAVEVRAGPDATDLPGAVAVAAVVLDEVIPAARAAWRVASTEVEVTAFRAPVWPAGVDVLTVRLVETGAEPATRRLVLRVSEGARIGARSVSLGGRTVVALPRPAAADAGLREWGFDDDAQSMPGWARPRSGYDQAFANIRAGMGGVPIVYTFAVEPGGAADVVLGFCESHWESAGSRFMTCKVEGAELIDVDPLARFGRHQPGGVLLEGRDANGDGRLDVLVLPGPGSPDRNPILNAIWLLPAGQEVETERVITGKLNALALRYVDVGGEPDQSVHPQGRVEYPVVLDPGGSEEFTFLVACPGGSAPAESTWTPESLRRAACDVWKDWRDR